MSRLNFREACLLDASGELGKAARREFLEYIRDNPGAAEEYRDICQTFESLESIPPTEFSARQRVDIPANIKLMLRRVLLQQEREKQATARHKLTRYALGTVGAIAAALAIMLTLMTVQNTAHRRAEGERVAKGNNVIDHLLAIGEQPENAYEQAVNDVEASIRQLQTQSPTLAQVQDHNMANLLDALVMVPEDWETSTDSASPGAM